MDNVDGKNSSQQGSPNPGTLWFVLACLAVTMAIAVVPSAGLFAQQGPPWLAVAVGLAVFPVLPLLWHGLAELRSREGSTPWLSPKTRFGLRSLAVALVVLGVSFVDLGPKQVVQNLRNLAGRIYSRPEPQPAPTPPPAKEAPKQVTFYGLEPFIPADASLAVGLAGSAAMEQLLAAHGVDTREKIAALQTCKIDFVNARVLIASRGRGTNMIVIRAPGITDERNLYCLVGVMGPNRLQLRPDEHDGNKLLHITGLLPRPLSFRIVDQSTVIAVDQEWNDTSETKLFANVTATPMGRLALPLGRVDRTAPLWVASVDETPAGAWDLAIDSRQDGKMFKLQGSATPPSGEADRAEISLRVPLAFASALPESAVALGIRGVVAAVVATGAARSAATTLPVPPPPAAPPKGAAVPKPAVAPTP
jgi:hypothetical protein